MTRSLSPSPSRSPITRPLPAPVQGKPRSGQTLANRPLPSPRRIAGGSSRTTVVRLQAGESAIATLLVGHNFLGVHAPEVVAGTLQGNVVVRVDWANGTVTQETINLSVERSTYTADC